MRLDADVRAAAGRLGDRLHPRAAKGVARTPACLLSCAAARQLQSHREKRC